MQSRFRVHLPVVEDGHDGRMSSPVAGPAQPDRLCGGGVTEAEPAAHCRRRMECA
jgi:hypothetical protein